VQFIEFGDLMKTRRAKTAVLRRSKRQHPSQALRERLPASRVLMPQPRPVAAYLNAHRALATLIPQICALVREALGPAVELSLELYSDPEIDDRYLTLYMRKETYDAGLRKQLEQLRIKTNPDLERVSGYLLLRTDFRRPRGEHAV
jgi:hypothetical protein